MFVKFFIDRPIFALVVSIIIVICGAVCIPFLPIAQFPEITPPTVQVSASYTGAGAEVVEKSVTTPIEKQVNGVEGMMYMSSSSANDGSASINVTFDVGYDLNIAAVDVQNRVDIADPSLPEDVKRTGVTTTKQSTNMVAVINLLSDGRQDQLFLSNYADLNIVDAIKRIPGVGDVTIFGERKYSMRIWLDPDKLASLKLTPSDVNNAIQAQNLQVAAGSIGSAPSPDNQIFTYNLSTQGRLETVEQFGEIVIRTKDDGSFLRVKDVADVELGAEQYMTFSRLDGKETISVGIYQLPGANSLDLIKSIREEMNEQQLRFPEGMTYKIAYDTTLFVSESITEVLHTLFEAFILVFFVVYIFLQSWRATLIPTITIPVSLIGTFALMMILGFSINTLSLFGLVLAIGLVVDDAIVVVENVERVMADKGLPPKQATAVAMGEVTGPVLATTLVLFAVFVPVAFMPGISGRLYNQFALTICCSVGISCLNALTLSPALCGAILKHEDGPRFWFFRKFNDGFDYFRDKAMGLVHVFLHHWKPVMLAFLVLLGATAWLFTVVPTGFVPMEDQGYYLAMIQAPEGTSLARTEKVCEKVEKIAGKIDGVKDVLMIGGYDMIAGNSSPSAATAFVILEPWSERLDKGRDVDTILMEFNGQAMGITEAVVYAFNAPPISGLSTTGGFEFVLQDTQGRSTDELSETAGALIQASANYKELSRLSTTFGVNYPQFYVDLDRDKALAMGVNISDVFSTLQAYLGSLYVNDFNKYGNIYRVFMQARAENRKDQYDITSLYVRNAAGDMVPLSALVTIKQIRGPQAIKHYNVFRSATINGNPAPGYSSGQAIAAMERLAKENMPDGYTFEWTGTALQEVESGGMAPYIFTLALVFVFLFLAAQYESWSMPLMIMLAVPLAILGALAFQEIRGLDNDVYCQIGLVMLIGLAAKNAILIVEFAKNLRESGLSIEEAAVQAAKERLRPILMTSFAFILGLMPLVLASGAGAASRHSLGTAVVGGMIASTFLSILIVPIFYAVIEKAREKYTKHSDAA